MMRLRIAALATGALLVIAGCDKIPGTPYSEARAAVSAYLFDPAAGRFTYDAETNRAVCGTVNSKNRMGAYVGAKPFIYDKLVKFASLYDGPPTGSDVRLWLMTDSDDPEWADRFASIYANCQFPKQWTEMCGTQHAHTPNEICQMIDASDLQGLRDRFGTYAR